MYIPSDLRYYRVREVVYCPWKFCTFIWATIEGLLGDTFSPSIYVLGKHASGDLYRQPSENLQSTSFTMIWVLVCLFFLSRYKYSADLRAGAIPNCNFSFKSRPDSPNVLEVMVFNLIFVLVLLSSISLPADLQILCIWQYVIKARTEKSVQVWIHTSHRVNAKIYLLS